MNNETGVIVAHEETTLGESMRGTSTGYRPVASKASETAVADTPAVTLTEVCVSYRSREVLSGLTTEFHEGLIHGIIGPNGAGKSTLVKAILGLLPYRGLIDVRGHDPAGIHSRARAKLMSYLPQEIPPVDMIGRDYVAMGRYPWCSRIGGLKEDDVRHVEEALEITGAKSWSTRPVRATSGGERQLTALSRAIAQDAKILLVDEPSAALDMGHEMTVFRLLRPWLERGDGRTVLVVLHDLSLAARFCDRLTLLVEGKIVAQGTPEAVLRPQILHDAYGVTVDVSRNKATGSLHVTALD